MSQTIAINLAVEDALSEVVLRKMLESCERPFEVANCYYQGGFGYLKKRISGFNNAARGVPFLVLTDLDRSECAPTLISEWLPNHRHPNLLFRVAVREVEAWLLAHRPAFVKFLAVSEAHIPLSPESIDDPKRTLISAARRSKRREIREAIVPAEGTTAKQGPDYNSCLARFVTDVWNPHAAKQHADSLKRAMRCLEQFSQS